MLFSSVIQQASEILKQGGLVGIPTETVYGLGADAKNPDALEKIFIAKGRPTDHPLIVHIAHPDQLTEWARDIPEVAWQLAKTFWPGPLTLILKKAPGVLDYITGHQDTVGIRIPNHPIALQLLQAFRGGIAAPSANKFGRISPTTAEAVREELGQSVDLILDGGPCQVGVESTILDVSSGDPRVLRPGMISSAQIEHIIGQLVVSVVSAGSAMRVSGCLESHYAPRTPVKIVSLQELVEYHQPGAVLLRHDIPLSSLLQKVNMPLGSAAYAHELYAVLRAYDKQNFACLLVEEVPKDAEWDAIRDRLQRASAVRFEQ